MRGSRLSLGVVASLAITLTLASVAYGGPIKKLYTVNISAVSPPVTVGQAETFNVVVVNKTATQQLGSCNLTLPSAPTSPGSLSGLSVTQPAVGTATPNGNVIELRNLDTPAMGSRTFTFTGTAPLAGVYKSTVECRQANNYSSPTPSNLFTLDTANSNLNFTAANPVPQADLSVVTQSRTPSGTIAGGNTVTHILVVTNNGPAASGNTVTFSDAVTGSGSISYIAGPSGWTCGGSSCSSTAAGGALANGASATFEVRVQVPTVSSNSSFTNTASVSQSGESADPNSGNNSSATTTTVTPGSSNGSGFVSNVSGGTVITEPFATFQNQAVLSMIFPGQDGATSGGFLYTIEKTTDTCGLFPCTFAFRIDDIPAVFDNPATESVHGRFKCDVTVCTGTGTTVTMYYRDETGQQKLVLPCNFLGIADPNPCTDGAERLIGGQDQGDLLVRMNFLVGDPKVAGLCLGGC
ncbi:MAG: hypothetical protein ACRDKS_17930 [Actinomycetota bacterium]